MKKEKQGSVEKLLGLALPKDKSKKGSTISAIIASVVIALIVGILSLKTIRAKRKAAQLEHLLRRANLNKQISTLKFATAKNQAVRQRAALEIKVIDSHIQKNKKILDVAMKKHEKFVKELKEASSWDQINLV